MADDFVQVAVDGAGKKIDSSSLTVGANTVERQRINFADPVDPAGIAGVKATPPISTDYGAIVRQVNPAQGDSATAISGPMVQGVVNDTPSSYIVAAIQPLSLTPEGRLRVSSVNSDIKQAWQNTFDDSWPGDGLWEMSNPYV